MLHNAIEHGLAAMNVRAAFALRRASREVISLEGDRGLRLITM